MGKKGVMISVNENLHKEIKEKGYNFSQICNDAISRKLLGTEKKNVPEEAKKVFCSVCKKEIDHGYYCPDSRKAWCVDCHKDVNMERDCAPFYTEMTYANKQGSYRVHEHIYWQENINHRPIEETGFLKKDIPHSENRNEQLR